MGLRELMRLEALARMRPMGDRDPKLSWAVKDYFGDWERWKISEYSIEVHASGSLKIFHVAESIWVKIYPVGAWNVVELHAKTGDAWIAVKD